MHHNFTLNLILAAAHQVIRCRIFSHERINAWKEIRIRWLSLLLYNLWLQKHIDLFRSLGLLLLLWSWLNDRIVYYNALIFDLRSDWEEPLDLGWIWVVLLTFFKVSDDLHDLFLAPQTLLSRLVGLSSFTRSLLRGFRAHTVTSFCWAVVEPDDALRKDYFIYHWHWLLLLNQDEVFIEIYDLLTAWLLWGLILDYRLSSSLSLYHSRWVRLSYGLVVAWCSKHQLVLLVGGGTWTSRSYYCCWFLRWSPWRIMTVRLSLL